MYVQVYINVFICTHLYIYIDVYSFIHMCLLTAACLAMEKQLEKLGSRWAAVCRWTEEQWVVLQEVLLRWQQFSDEQNKFQDWLTAKELVLEQMGHADLMDTDQVIMQVKHLKVRTGLNLTSI